MKTSDFYYDLPKELIAQSPAPKRDESRLMVIDREKKTIEHKQFKHILNYLRPGDVLVVNNSRVLPARLIGTRPGGGAAELLLLREIGEKTWEALAKPSKRIREGDTLVFGDGLIGTVEKCLSEGRKIIIFSCEKPFLEALSQAGSVPLPPYITDYHGDTERYQTVYAKENGSVAAPTAGLHFTPELIKNVADMGATVAEITLHVGLGTFRPVQVTDIKDHIMHEEYYVIPENTAKIINNAKQNGSRIIAVGTTSCRTLESAADDNGKLVNLSGNTSLFITPGYRFRMVDALITNFHLPESTLLMLISAFAGRENIMKAYKTAVDEQYRFFSFGDAMFII